MSTELKLTPGEETMRYADTESSTGVVHSTLILETRENMQLEVVCRACELPANLLTPTPIAQGSRSWLRFYCGRCRSEWSLVMRNASEGESVDIRCRPVVKGAEKP